MGEFAKRFYNLQDRLVPRTMLTIGDEEDLLEDIIEGLEIALHRTGQSSENVDPIKVNKLVFFAIRDLGVPVTYGWYKYGPAPVFDVESARVTATPASEIAAADEPRILDPGEDYYSPLEYSYYFEADCEYFERILQTPTKEFLREFYEDFAPDPYGPVYETSTQVQVLLDELERDDRWHEEADDFYESLNRALNELKRELLQVQQLAEVLDQYRKYSRLVKDVVAEAAAQDDLSPAQERFVTRVVKYYRGGVWNYVALLISKNTVHLSPGDNDSKLLNAIDGELRELRGNIDDELLSLKEQSRRRNLAPHRLGDESRRKTESDGEGEQNEEGLDRIEAWTKISSEAIGSELSNADEVEEFE